MTKSQNTIALAGNPNVGKSTIFNALTGMHQHTGNWPGKTVAVADGLCSIQGKDYTLIDLPGTYSLMAHSPEEEIARDFLCFSHPDAVILVCDAGCLERNLNLVLQTLEITDKVVVCVNLLDEAQRKQIHIDLHELSRRLGVPAVGTNAHKPKSLDALFEALVYITKNSASNFVKVQYDPPIEQAISILEPALRKIFPQDLLPLRWLSLQLLAPDESLLTAIHHHLGIDLLADETINNAVRLAQNILYEVNLDQETIKDRIAASLFHTAKNMSDACVEYKNTAYAVLDRRLDRIFTGRMFGYPTMLLLLAMILWLTIEGANYPSQLLQTLFNFLETKFSLFLQSVGIWTWLHDALIFGVFRVLSWVVAVMLPPMAIFFPLFTLLEDAGYLPRIAYNLDRPFARCAACGKQALTMCMGFGCNAVGVVGCRIIDSPRERLLATLTNNFVPCNGRFPILISLVSIFFVFSGNRTLDTVCSVGILTLLICLGIGTTFAVTKLLSRTVLRGMPSSYLLELPSYRRPQFGRVIVRSLFDRTLFVLARAAVVAAPAGLVIWLLANLEITGIPILAHCAGFLDPFARLMGLDGVILLAFILGFPANEIVVPIILMAYMAQGNLTPPADLAALREILLANGWTWVTALCTMLFSLLHWPCSTTLLSIHKETGSMKWTALAFVLPTALGIAVCICVNLIAKLVL